ncbi:MAG: RecX family transcriptional regulator, partial [Ignavibacteriae bacterium]|nr:RecX family transcriptional regulator [Ignavibacteriota bacterium]
DEEFAKNFYKNQLRKKRGVLKIKADLYKKGVNRNLIEKIIRENINTEDFIESAKILANKKINMLKKRDIPEVKIKQKVFQFLASRGFTSEVINKTLKIVEMED